MIRNLVGRTTQDIWDGENTYAARKIPREIWKVAQRKLDMIQAAYEPPDLRIPPGNHLEKLKGNLKDRYSIRINDQYRIIFKWTRDAAEDVEIVDYH